MCFMLIYVVIILEILTFAIRIFYIFGLDLNMTTIFPYVQTVLKDPFSKP